MSRRTLLITLAAVALVVVVALGLRSAPESRTASESGRHPLDQAQVAQKLGGAPPALANLHRRANALLPGSTKALDAELAKVKGHPAVVNVWAAWCGPCIGELPILQQLSLDYGKQVAFLGVDYRDNRGRAEQLLQRIPVTYPSVEDPRGKAEGKFKLIGTPTTIFYDAAGRQTFAHAGVYSDRKSLEDDIRRYALGRA